MVQFYIRSGASADGKSTVLLVERIRMEDSDDWFVFPPEYQILSIHKHLLEMSPIKRVKSSLTTRNHYRIVTVKLEGDAYSSYIDEYGNLIFEEFQLECYENVPVSVTPQQTFPDLSSLNRNLDRLASKQESVGSILKHFVIEKFNPKNRNVNSWCSLFEQECARFNLTGEKQIEVFKSCLDDNVQDWFVLTQSTLGLTTTWLTWKENLIASFEDNSFSAISYAIGFKYFSGSLVEYAIKKEKMLTEVDKSMAGKQILIDLIVFGLPANIQKSLKRNSIDSTLTLRMKLKKYEGEGTPTKSSAYQNSKKKQSHFTYFEK